MFLMARYGVQTSFTFSMVKRGVVDLAAGADWTPATGDTKLSKDGGNVANSTNNPAAVGGTGSVDWSIVLTAAELTARVVDVQIVDSATKAVEDQFFKIYMYGDVNSKLPFDFADQVRGGLTSLPNAAAQAAGGLFTIGTGAGQVNQDANGRIDTNIAAIGAVTANATNFAAMMAQLVLGTVTNAGFAPTATEFECSDITEATASHFRGRTVYARNGVLLQSTGQIVTAYSLVAGRGHFTTTGSTTGEVFANGALIMLI